MNLLPLADGGGAKIEGLGSVSANAAILGIRPEDFHLGAGAPGDVAIGLTVEAVEKVGAETFIYGARPDSPGNQDLIVRVPGQSAPAPGEHIRATAPRDKLHLFSADGRQRIET